MAGLHVHAVLLAVPAEREDPRGMALARLAGLAVRAVATLTFPTEERFGLTSQLRRAAVSVPSNIAEGSKRLVDDNKHFLRYALGSLAECDTQLTIAESLGYGEYSKQLKATIMSLTMGIRAYGKSLA